MNKTGTRRLSVMESISIYLRQRLDGKTRFLVEVRSDDAKPASKGKRDEAFYMTRFCKEVKKRLPLQNPEGVDIFIGWYGSQSGFTFPPEFLELAVTNRWPVEFSIND